MPLTPGSRFGPYTIVAQLGTGGMGVVFRASDPRLGRDVAVKVMRGQEPKAAALDRLLAEATLASSLNHPNIVTIYETGVIDSNHYLAMELVQGTTLREWRSRGWPPIARSKSSARPPRRSRWRMPRRSCTAT